MERMNQKLVWVIGALAFVATSCGKGPKSPSVSQTLGTTVAATVTASGLDPVVALYSWNGVSLTVPELQAMAKTAAERKLASVGIVAAELPQFFAFDVNLGKLTGCEVWSTTAYCRAGFGLTLTVTTKAGPDQLDAVAMAASFASLERSEVTRRLTWTVDALIAQLVSDGLLASLGVETPYF